MPLLAGNFYFKTDRTASPNFYHLTKFFGIGWLADQTVSNWHVMFLHPPQNFFSAVYAVIFFIISD
jgi:hypothetical protein